MFIFVSFRIMGLRESDSRSNFTCALRKEINFRSRLSNFKEIFQSFLRLWFLALFLVETRQGQGNGDAGQNVAERGKTKTTQGDCAGTLLCTTYLCFTVFFISSLSTISVLGNYYYYYYFICYFVVWKKRNSRRIKIYVERIKYKSHFFPLQNMKTNDSGPVTRAQLKAASMPRSKSPPPVSRKVTRY